MGKRAAVAPAKASKVAKTAVEEAPAIAVEDPFLKECEPVVKFLSTAEVAGGEEARTMLRLGAPFALKIASEGRHRYQTSIVEAIEMLIASTGRNRAVQVETAQASCASLEVEEATATEGLNEIHAAVAEKTQQSVEKAAAYKSATEALDAAKQAFQTEKTAASNLVAQARTRETEKKAHDAARTELWEPLKANAFEPKEWRARDKKLAEVQRFLAQAGAPESLVAASGVAFKTSVESRSKFALTAIEHGEIALAAHVENLGNMLGAAEAETAASARQVEAAESAVEQAHAAQQEAKCAQQEANAELAAEQHGERAKQHELKQFAPRRKHLAAELEAATVACDDAAKLAATFESLKVGPGSSKASEAALEDAAAAVDRAGAVVAAGC